MAKRSEREKIEKDIRKLIHAMEEKNYDIAMSEYLCKAVSKKNSFKDSKYTQEKLADIVEKVIEDEILKDDIKVRIRTMIEECDEDMTFSDMWVDLTEGKEYILCDYNDTDFAKVITDVMEDVVSEETGVRQQAIPAKTKRMVILAKALRDKKGLKEVERELRANNHNILYLRNYIELILYFSFANNDDTVEDAKKIGIKEFYEIKRRCDNVKENIKDGKENDVVSWRFSNSLSLYELKEYIDRNSQKDGDIDDKLVKHYVTQQFTSAIHKELKKRRDKIETGNEDDIIEAVKELVLDNTQYYVLNNERSRYYIAKYLYYFICRNIADFIDILKKMSMMTHEEFIKYCQAYEEDGKRWSMSYKLSYMVNNVITYNHKIINDKYTQGVPHEKNIISDKLSANNILKFLFKELYVVKNCHMEEDGLPLQYFDKSPGCLFKGGQDEERHQEMEKLVNQLKIEDFYKYNVRVSDLSYIIFYGITGSIILPNQTTNEVSISEENDAKGKKNPAKSTEEQFKDALYGKSDVSRGMLLHMLMVMNQILKDDFHEQVDRERIDKILINCGFNDLRPGENVFDMLVDISLRMDNIEFMDTFGEFLNAYYEGQGRILMDIKGNTSDVRDKEETFIKALAEYNKN